MAAPGVGAVVSLIILGSLEERWSQKALLWFTAVATPLLLILFCLSRYLELSVLLLAVFGGMQIIFRTVSRLIIQDGRYRDHFDRADFLAPVGESREWIRRELPEPKRLIFVRALLKLLQRAMAP